MSWWQQFKDFWITDSTKKPAETKDEKVLAEAIESIWIHPFIIFFFLEKTLFDILIFSRLKIKKYFFNHYRY